MAEYQYCYRHHFFLLLLQIFFQLGRLDGVVLLDWNDDSLETQIEFGAREGKINLDKARQELRNYRKNVIPAAEYFDYKQLLYVVRILWG